MRGIVFNNLFEEPLKMFFALALLWIAAIVAVYLIHWVDELYSYICMRIRMRKFLSIEKSRENSIRVLKENIIKLKETKAKLSSLSDKVKAQSMSDSLDKVIDKLEVISVSIKN